MMVNGVPFERKRVKIFIIPIHKKKSRYTLRFKKNSNKTEDELKILSLLKQIMKNIQYAIHNTYPS